MRPEAVLMKRIRLAVAKDNRARLVPNFVALVVPWATPDAHPVNCGLGKGSADLVGMLRGSGRVVALEVKTPTGTDRPEQARWRASVRAWGGFACIVRSPEEALAAVARAIAGASQ